MNGRTHYFETGADDVIAALEAICARRRRNIIAKTDKDGWRH
jgi:hypothetical protein